MSKMTLTPELEDVLQNLCDTTTLGVHLNTFDKVEDLLLDGDYDHDEDGLVLSCIRDIRALARDLQQIQDVLLGLPVEK